MSNVDDAVRQLDSKKRWLENMITGKRAPDAQRYLTQLSDQLKQYESGVLKGTPQLATWQAYLQDATNRVNTLQLAEQADELIRKWNDGMYVLITVHI